MIYDGLDAIFNIDATEVNAASQTVTQMQKTDGWCGTSKDSAVVYDSHGNWVGTMGYTT